MTTLAPSPRLDEYDKDEWWDVVRVVKPQMTREEYDAHWEEFHAHMARRAHRLERQ